ncbi:HYR domain-containing protein, partial [Algoriphagus sp. SE2]|uniref:HYR domain-containing protein n=1 Tax=Algoriphagus sp. SE2 TaxID=3141536 RepID=UPI0031CCFA61
MSADANCQGNATAADFDNGSFDPDGDEISFSVSPAGPYPLGRTPVTLTVTDSKGAFAIATAEVVVEDKTAPVITVPADIMVDNDANACGAVVNFNPTVADNCSGGTTLIISPAPNTFFPVGTTTVTVDATDEAGNAAAQQSFTVTVLDAEAPVTPVLADATGECSVTVDAPTTTDNCVGTITGTTTDPTEYTAQGTYQINWTFDDGNGNSTSAIQNVIVKDVTAPVITLITPTPTAELGLTNTVTLLATEIFAAT